jgi:hypothetical protein
MTSLVTLTDDGFESARHPPAHEPRPWTPGPHDHWMRLLPKEVTGRRIVLDQATSTSGGG